MNKKYLLIDTYLTGIHSDSGFYTIGLPSLTSFAGSFHNIQRKLQENMQNLEIKNFLIGFKDLNIRNGKKFIESKNQSKYVPKKTNYVKNYPNPEKYFADGKFIFILELNDITSFDEKKIRHHFLSLINFFKICGGIFNETQFFFNEELKPLIKKFQNTDYFILDDQSHLIKNKKNPVKELLSYISYDNNSIPNINKLYIPMVNGYQLLEKPILKNNFKNSLRNQDYKHAYAEPTLTICKLLPINHLIYANNNILNHLNCMWNYHVENQYYIIKGIPIL